MGKQCSKSCCICGKTPLDKNEIGANKKILGKDVTSFYCLECLAEYLEISVEDLKAKIEDFKREGCKLFS